MSLSELQFQQVDEEIKNVSVKFNNLKIDYERELKNFQTSYKDKFKELKLELRPIQDKFTQIDRTELIVNTIYNGTDEKECPRANITKAEIHNLVGRIPGKIEECATIIELDYTVDGREVKATIHGKRNEYLFRYEGKISKNSPDFDIAKDSDMARRLFYLLQKDADNFRKLDENLFVNSFFAKTQTLYKSMTTVETGFIR